MERQVNMAAGELTAINRLRIRVGRGVESLSSSNILLFPEDLEIILLKARLEQTERTLERLIGNRINIIMMNL